MSAASYPPGRQLFHGQPDARKGWDDAGARSVVARKDNKKMW